MARIALTTAINEVAVRDPVLAHLIAKIGPIRYLPRFPDGAFGFVVRAIVSQEISGAAAQAIIGRVTAAVGGSFSPEAFGAVSDETLRTAGLSRNKIDSLREISAKMLDGAVDRHMSTPSSDEEIIARLSTVRGIGRWSAEMYLMHCLRRLDVWPVADLDVRGLRARVADRPGADRQATQVARRSVPPVPVNRRPILSGGGLPLPWRYGPSR